MGLEEEEMVVEDLEVENKEASYNSVCNSWDKSYHQTLHLVLLPTEHSASL